MPELPAPIRAVFGLVASVTDVVKDGHGLPELVTDRVLELPVLAVSTVLQLSLRAQQQYAALTVRGDEFLNQLRGGAPEEPPPWAQFDDDPTVAPDQPPAEAAAPKPAVKQPAATKKAATKKVPAPRTGKPSAFDLVETDGESAGE